MSDGGKGDKRRPGDQDAYSDNWDKIFGKSKQEKALEELVRISEELKLYDEHNPMVKKNETE